jgi:hypothetical protein
VEGSIPGPTTSKRAAAHVRNVGSTKESDEQATTQEEEDAILKKYETAKHHEAVVYVAKTMKKQHDKDSVMCAYNFQ